VTFDEVAPAHRESLEALNARLKILLPADYQDSYEDLQPVPMRSAGLKYDANGQVAWDQIWGSFCDLAMAGGPPHKGSLLAHGARDAIDAQMTRYDEVVEEIGRGIRMVTGLRVSASSTPGWVCVTCFSDGMAGWLLRAIVMENVDARRSGAVLELPAAPHFRIDKEIKNVITVIAKTCHYWLGHMSASQRYAVAALLARMQVEGSLLTPDASPEHAKRSGELASVAGDLIEGHTGLRASHRRYAGWLGLECLDVRSAVWMMRALVAGNTLSRR
jgi:sirohydrochlorin cobaltochelatase